MNSLESQERQRFTICHEIAHIALELESSHDELPSWSYAKRHPNEVLCDTFAAELLMPYQQWLDLIPRSEPSQALIEHMASTFKTSFPASASRFASLTDMPCAFVTMDKGVIRYAARSAPLRRIGVWISPRSPIPCGSVSYNLRSAGQSASETGEIAQDIWFDEWDQGLDLWEMSRHYHRSDTTIALLWFDAADLPEIEIDRFGRRTADGGGLTELTGGLPWPSKSRRR